MRVEDCFFQHIADGASNTRTTGTDAAVRMKSRRAGFKIGGFGVSFSSDDVYLDESLSPEVREAARKKRAFQTERQVSELRRTVANNAWAQYAAQSKPRPTAMTQNIALNAYRNASAPEPALPGQYLRGQV